MKKEDAVKIVRDKRILACIALLLVLIIAALCAAALKQNAGRRAGGMASLMADSLENSGFSWLPSERRELEKAAEAAQNFWTSWSAWERDARRWWTAFGATCRSLDGADGGTGGRTCGMACGSLSAELRVRLWKTVRVEQTETGISETYLEEMRTDLENISEYLTQLDASVTGNKEELVSLTEIRNGNYEELTEYLEGMKNVISAIRTELSEYQNSQSDSRWLPARSLRI